MLSEAKVAVRWLIAILFMPFAILFDFLDTFPPDPYFLRNYESHTSRLIRYARRSFGESND